MFAININLRILGTKKLINISIFPVTMLGFNLIDGEACDINIE